MVMTATGILWLFVWVVIIVVGGGILIGWIKKLWRQRTGSPPTSKGSARDDDQH
jgi:hypothetical protein